MATANFTFTTLTGTETAGWNSINSLITSIDTQLNASNRLIYMSGWSAVAGQTIKWDAANSRWVPGTLDAAAFANNSVELGTKTTGDYVASIAAAGTNEVSVTGTGEGAAATVRLANNTALRGAATVETPPTYSGGSTGTVGRVPDAKYVTDALAYATSGNVTLGGDVTGNASANTIANGAVTSAKILDGTIVNADINASAAIAYSKLNLNGAIQPSDLNTAAQTKPLIVALSDETTALTTGTSKVTMRAPSGMTITQIPRLALGTASSSGLVTVDVNVNGSSILGANKLSIDATEKTSTTAATPTTLASNPTSISDDAEITFDIDAAGTGAKSLKITLYYVAV